MTVQGLSLALGSMLWLALPVAQGQTTPTQTAQATSPASSAHRHHRTHRHQGDAVTQRIPMEQPNLSPATTPDVSAAQRAADARLLAQQEARSARDAKVNDQQVQKVESQQKAQDAQQRIQDTPGPSQSVLVPGYPPVVGTSPTPQRIDDAPGPVPTTVPTAPQL